MSDLHSLLRTKTALRITEKLKNEGAENAFSFFQFLGPSGHFKANLEGSRHEIHELHTTTVSSKSGP